MISRRHRRHGGPIDELGFLDDMASSPELGIWPLLIPLISTVAGPLLQNLLGGGQQPAAPSAGAVPDAGAGAADIAGALLQSIPATVREQVRAVVNETRASGGTLADVGRQITNDVDARFQPAAREAVNALAVAQTQTDATQEHRAIVQDTERWNTNRQSQAAILARLEAISSRLGGARS